MKTVNYMTINLNLFGAGVGLVLIGWMCGLVVSYLFGISSSIGRSPSKRG